MHLILTLLFLSSKNTPKTHWDKVTDWQVPQKRITQAQTSTDFSFFL